MVFNLLWWSSICSRRSQATAACGGRRLAVGCGWRKGVALTSARGRHGGARVEGRKVRGLFCKMTYYESFFGSEGVFILFTQSVVQFYLLL